MQEQHTEERSAQTQQHWTATPSSEAAAADGTSRPRCMRRLWRAAAHQVATRPAAVRGPTNAQRQETASAALLRSVYLLL